jgi:hypothetical protein
MVASQQQQQQEQTLLLPSPLSTFKTTKDDKAYPLINFPTKAYLLNNLQNIRHYEQQKQDVTQQFKYC